MSPFTVEEVYGVKKVAENRYIGNRPLNKPTPRTRDVYGGNFCAQAVLVGIESAPKGTHPIRSTAISYVVETPRFQLSGRLKSYLTGNHLQTESSKVYKGES